MSVENLGIANVTVKLYEEAPNLARINKKYNFDVSAYNYQVIQNSPFVKPLLAEYVVSPEGTMAAFHPSKRKLYINNALGVGTTETSPGTILWNQLSLPPDGLPNNIVKNGKYDTYNLLPLTDYSNIPSDYKGPIWWDNKIAMQPVPDDKKTIAAFFDLLDKTNDANDVVSEDTPETTEVDQSKWPKVTVVHQSAKRDGLWWAIESNDFLEENTPFWVHFKKMESPSSADHETCFVIRIGPTNDVNKFDIYLSLNNKPQIIDYVGVNDDELKRIGGGTGGGANVPNQQEWNNDLARVMSSNSDIEVGIMTIAGRLVVIVNNVPLVYTRINRESGDDGGQLLECKIPPGKIQIFGTNAEVSVMVCPMVFAELSVLALPLPIIMDDSGKEAKEIKYQGSDSQGHPRGSVAELPSSPSYNGKLFGVDCARFTGDGGSCSPYGPMFHRKGSIIFEKASKSTFNALPSTNFYVMFMQPSSDTTIANLNIKNGGCPYFFRLKGIYEKVVEGSANGKDISEYLISVDETAQAPDYFHAKKNASLTFYNPNNIVGDMVIEKQTAIDISWGWSGISQDTKTFTGVVTSMSKSEVPGKETITLNCDDYIHVLRSIPIVNSPFYDGMVMYYAVRDLAERAGITTFVKDWDNAEEYGVPAGFSFSQPKMRFDSQQMIFDCIIKMVQLDQAFVFFDGEGRFHIAKLPGGLIGDTSGLAPTGIFVSNMEDGGAGNTILEERSVDISFDQTVNTITILTVERDTRNAVFYECMAENNKLVFLKPSIRKEGTYGELAVARYAAHELGKRIFFPILKTRFKTTGVNSIVLPLDFVTVDGHMFRVMSVKRSFVAETNDMNCSYECEWLYGE